MNRNGNHYRQGDVCIIKANNIDKSKFSRVDSKKFVTLAYGEVTGHHHSIKLEDYPYVELYRDSDGRMILTVPDEATITHQEHAPLYLPTGDYEVFIQQEYSDEGMRNVAD